MTEIGTFIRESLLKLSIGDTVNFPLTQKTSLYQQTQDLAMFFDLTYKTTTDKTRHEVIVTRTR